MPFDISDKKILITGATGSVGKQLLFELTKRNIQPITHVRESSDTSYVDSLKLEKRVADLRQKDKLNAIMAGVDAVIHTAAIVDFRGNQLTEFTGTNVMGAIYMYEAAVKAGVKRFVHISSVAAVGGINRYANGNLKHYHLANESNPYELEHLKIPYFMTKRAAEIELLALAKNSPTELVIVNPSIIAAPRRNFHNQLSRQFNRMFIPEIPIRINVVDLRDVVPGIISALKCGRPNERYILGGDNITLRELVLEGSAVLGKAPHLVRIPRRVYDLTSRFAEILAKLTGRRRVSYYPDLVKLLDYDWAFSSKKAHDELGYRWRSIQATLENILTDNMIGTWCKPTP